MFESGQIVRHNVSGALFRVIRFGFMGPLIKYGRQRKAEEETVSAHALEPYTLTLYGDRGRKTVVTRYHESPGGVWPIEQFVAVMGPAFPQRQALTPLRPPL